mgnify:CR=1 FL=1
MNQSDKKQPYPDFTKYSSLAFQMLIIIFLGVFSGYKLDKYLNFKFPLFTLLFSFLSITLAIYIGIKDFIKKK